MLVFVADGVVGGGSELGVAAGVFRRFGADFDFSVVSGEDAVGFLSFICAHEKVVAGIKMLCARRIDETRSWARSGHCSAASLLAKESGEPVGTAKRLLETASEVASLPGVEHAVRNGGLSPSQAGQIASAVKADPTSERKLLETAGTGSFSDLKTLSGRVRAAADTDPMESYRKVHNSRYLRRWTTPDGAFNLQARLTPDAGAKLWARIEDETDLLHKEARRARCGDRFEALQADALVALATSDTQSTPTTQIFLNVDAAALLRGHITPGELCEIDGAGPIPVEIAETLFPAAYVKTIVKNGTDVKTISHHSRAISPTLKTAVKTRDHGTCVVPGCDNHRYTETDHIITYAQGGKTRLDNLATLCTWHHRQKTLHGWQITHTNNQWHWKPPPQPPQPD